MVLWFADHAASCKRACNRVALWFSDHAAACKRVAPWSSGSMFLWRLVFALQALADQLALEGRPFDFDSLLDVLMVCHYNTRVSTST